MAQLEEAQSLKLIQEMLQVAKRSFWRMSYYFLMWGWLLAVAAVLSFALGQLDGYRHLAWIGWPVVGIVGGVLSYLYGRKQAANAAAESYMDKVFAYIWGGFMATLVVYIAASLFLKRDPGPGIIILTGLPTFATGGVLKFKPLLVGGALFWALGLLAHILPPAYASLVFFAALLVGYLVPGYLLKRAEQNGRL